MNVSSPVQFGCAASRVQFGADKKDPKKILADLLKGAATGDAFKKVKVEVNGVDLNDKKAEVMRQVAEALQNMEPGEAVDQAVAQLEKAVGKEAADAIVQTLKGDPSFLAGKVQEQGQAAENVLNAIAQNYGPRVATVVARPVQLAFAQAQMALGLISALPMLAPAKLQQLEQAVGPAAEKAADAAQKEADEKLAQKALAEALGAKGGAVIAALREKLYGNGPAENPLEALLKQMMAGMQPPQGGEAEGPAGEEGPKPPKSGDDNN